MFAGNKYYEFLRICAVFIILTFFISLICIGAAFLVTLGIVLIRFYFMLGTSGGEVAAHYLIPFIH